MSTAGRAPGTAPGTAGPRSLRWRTAALASGFGGLVLALFYGALVPPGRVLLARDVALFHLPLRSDLVRLLEHGVPAWNPWLHGGQPVLSNPSYAAFYPPTWLAAVVGPLHSLDLLVLLHAGLALAGAWRLARWLGAGRGAAALAAAGFAAGGTFLSLTESLSLYFGAAWLPWLLLAGGRTLAADPGQWRRPAIACGGVLALLALNGEPATTLCGALALAALAAERWLRHPPWRGRSETRLRPLRLLVPGLVATALAAVQVVPTFARLADSPRAGGLDYATATEWSARPLRLVELLVAHPFGDPTRVAEGLYFGVGLNDRDMPYIATLYPGMAVAVLALAGLAGGVRRRGLWALLVVAGVALGLGRFDPLYPLLHAHLPWLGGIRFPEKFLLLVALALPFAAALAWQRLLAADAPEQRFGRLAVVLAAVVAALAATWWMVLLARPELAAGFVRDHAPPQLTAAGVARGAEFLAGRAARATATALALAGLFALASRRRLTPPVASALLVALLIADLTAAHGSLLRTVPAAELTAPPPLARQLAARPGRLFSDADLTGGRTVVVAGEEPRLAQLRTQIASLDPAVGNLWGFAYALDEDYDLMLTRWGRHGLTVARTAHPVPEHFAAVLAAWDVGTTIHRRPLTERIAELTAGRPSPPVRAEPVAARLPRYRGVREVEFHADAEAAVAALADQGYAVGRREHWVGSPPPSAAAPGTGGAARVLAVTEAGKRIELETEAPAAGGAVTLAVTFDQGWRASAAGRPLALYPTALGQIGVVVPGGRGRLQLTYRDRWLAPAATVSGVALVGLLGLFLRRPRRGT